uniref:Uncharacterized protein n=1 Tax=Aegilops tauschii subsp. strangulata TaxID=200361 RepID=A0A453HB35_AEGTS
MSCWSSAAHRCTTTSSGHIPAVQTRPGLHTPSDPSFRAQHRQFRQAEGKPRHARGFFHRSLCISSSKPPTRFSQPPTPRLRTRRENSSAAAVRSDLASRSFHPGAGCQR